MPKGKKFIDKKNAVTFHLVHRSQQDPLAADEKAPQHVLVAAPAAKKKKKDKTSVEEEHKFGIFFDDDYDYLQHLRDTSKQTVQWVPVNSGHPSYSRALKENDKSQDDDENSEEEVYTVERPKQLNLPSSVFASEVEEDVGLLNKAAPQGLRLDLDPDIVAAMDEDFDFDDPENELEDNFIELANDPDASDEEDGSVGSDFNMSELDDEEEDGSEDGSETRDKVGKLGGRMCQFADEETRSRFTEYSMTSSVMRRNQQLSLLDHRFEKMFEEYDDNEIGALDCEEIEGYVPTTSDQLLECVAEFDKRDPSEDMTKDYERPSINLDALMESDSGDDLRDFEVREGNDEEKWDCQSILSTYSNIYNRPKVISERNSNPGKIRLSRKTGLPLGVFDSGNEKLTPKALAKLDAEQGSTPQAADRAETIISTLSTLSIRPKDETPEERRERKRLLKEYRRERIVERKANTAAFKDEKKRQEKILLNNKRNIPTLKIV